MLPNLVIIGAMKAGTSSLHRYLQLHPQVFMSEPKELRFFMAEGDGTWQRGRPWYEEQFAPAGAALVRGETSPGYAKATEFRGVPARMASLVPDAQLVYLVRDPIERMRSHYDQFVFDGWEQRPIARALREFPGYLDTSRYAFQLDAYLEHYRNEQMLVITSDDLLRRRREVLGRVASFLGIEPAWPEAALEIEEHRTDAKLMPKPWRKRVADSPGVGLARRLAPAPLRRAYHRRSFRPPGSARQPLPVDLVQELRERLAPDVARLRAYLGADFDGWGIA